MGERACEGLALLILYFLFLANHSHYLVLNLLCRVPNVDCDDWNTQVELSSYFDVDKLLLKVRDTWYNRTCHNWYIRWTFTLVLAL